MPTKKQQLQALGDQISLLQDQQIPHGVNSGAFPDVWNEDRSAVKTALPIVGDFFADSDGQITALRALFNADHDPNTGKNPVPPEWVVEATTPVFVNASQFQLANDRRVDYTTAQRIRAKLGVSFVIVAINGAPSYDAQQNVTTITVTPATLSAALAEVARGLVRTSMPKVQASDIVDGAIGGNALADLGVPGSKIALGAITRTKITDGEVITSKLSALCVQTNNLGNTAVTTPKLAVGASVNTRVAADIALQQQLTQTEATILTLPAMTTRGGPVLLVGMFCAAFTGANNAPIVARVKRDNATIATIDLAYIGNAAGQTGVYPISVLDIGAAAGVHTYTATVQCGHPAQAGFTLAANSGRVSALELA